MAAGISGEEFRAWTPASIASSTLLQRAVERNLRQQAGLTRGAVRDPHEPLQRAEIPASAWRNWPTCSSSRAAPSATRSPSSNPVGGSPASAPGDDERGVVARITPEGGTNATTRVFAGHIDIVRDAPFSTPSSPSSWRRSPPPSNVSRRGSGRPMSSDLIAAGYSQADIARPRWAVSRQAVQEMLAMG